MPERTLRLLVRTPQGSVFDDAVNSLRVPTDTGQVGLRPCSESTALVVEPGLALASRANRPLFIATAGGLLRCNGKEVVLLTPLAVVGESAASVRTALSDALGSPSSDLELRAVLQQLQTGILQELRRTSTPGMRGVQRG